MPRPRSLTSWAALGVLLLSTVPAQARDGVDGEHPAKAMIDRAINLVRTDPQASNRDTQAALELLTIRPDPDLELRARLVYCDHLSERDRVAAEAQVVLARALLPRATRPGLESGIYDCEGTILETAGDNVSAADRFEHAVAIAERTQDQEMLGGALFSRGYLLGVQGRYATGLADLKRAQDIYEKLNKPHHALTALNGIAILYNRMGDYAQARDMYQRALKAQRDEGMRREEGVTLHNLGRANENLLDWDAAQKAFQESYDISHALQYPRGEGYALRGLAAVANAKGQPSAALQILDRAAALQKQTPDARLHAQIQLARGIALHQLRRLSASIDALEEALTIFKEADSLNELRLTYSELAAVQSESGNWRDGYAHLERAQETAERLFRNQIDQRFATLKVEFDTAAKEKENVLLTRENKANQKALAQERRARGLFAVVITLTIMLAGLLATAAVHQWRTTHKMRTLAMTDELTGVPNRRAVLTRLEPLLAQTNTPSCAMLIIDIDHFKSINDQCGHPEGDEALKLVASKLREEVQEPAFIGRLGGEEFLVVLPGADLAAAHALAERCREQVMTIDTRRWLADRQITVSVGLTVSKATGDTPSSMLQRADAALYEAKRAGRNCVKASASTNEAAAARETAAENRTTDASGVRFA